ncbi:MAG: hypothetical protein CM1200mP41_35950 [Gammaproteobacteria bacterium]|nr:MAG: hypothetical protein CM1200mP41_35950 [Gammaproteobacteria bacterium]
MLNRKRTLRMENLIGAREEKAGETLTMLNRQFTRPNVASE